MPMSTPALSGAIAAGALAAFAVAGQRIGLGLALAVLLTITAGALNAGGRVCRVTLGLAGALATAPLLLDAGWVVAIDVIAALVAAAAAVGRPRTWSGVRRSLLAPWRLLGGTALVARSVRARRRDTPRPQAWAIVRGLALAALLVVTVGALFAAADSAHHRLDLVEDAYGFTRVRYAGHAIVLWLALVFGLVLAAGAHGGLRERLPRVVVLLTLGGVLAFSISNPDARIADRVVDRALAGGTLDGHYLGGLSADALPAIERLPPGQRDPIMRSLREDLRRADGLAGLNLSRARAR